MTYRGPGTRMVRMSQTHSALPRQVADAYVDELIALDPVTGTFLGVKESSSRLPDLSPAGQEALAELQRATLARLDEAERRPGADSGIERRCARLLRERLTAELAVHEADEGLRAVGNLGTVAHSVREVFTVTPAETEEDWAAIAERLRAVPAALAGYRESLALGLERKLYAAPRPTETFVGQLTEWADTGGGRGWFEDFAAAGPDALRTELDEGARAATAAVVELRDWMRDVYAPSIEGAPNTVGRERYARWARYYNGTDLDLDEAYAYGWSEYHRLLGEMKKEAEKILPGAGTPWVALAHLDEHGRHIEGVDEVRAWLQGVMDRAIESLDGTHFDLAERVRRVESRIAPAGSAAAPYYTPPRACRAITSSSRSGCTWPRTSPATRPPWAWSAPTPRAGRCTRSG
jgi:uncharacterized protein (DUF885 family)